MKKIILSLFLLFTMVQSCLATNIGYIDYGYIYKNYSLTKKYIAQLEAKAQEVRKYNLTTKQAIATQKTQEAKDKVKKERYAGLVKLEKEYIELKKQMDTTIRAKVKAASDVVLAQKKLDIITDKRFIMSGGIDCTAEVFKALK